MEWGFEMEVTSFNFLYMLEMLLPAIGLCIPLKLPTLQKFQQAVHGGQAGAGGAGGISLFHHGVVPSGKRVMKDPLVLRKELVKGGEGGTVLRDRPLGAAALGVRGKKVLDLFFAQVQICSMAACGR